MLWQACVAASDSIGLGHLVRVQALFEVAGIGLRNLWVWTDWSPDRLNKMVKGMPLSPVPLDTVVWPGDALPDALVVDMPDPPWRLLNETYQIRRKLLLGCSDARQSWADLTVNVAEGEPLDRLEPSPHECVWEGARFALLRPEFLKGRRCRHDPGGAILVAMGGTDPARLSLPITRELLGATVFAGRAIDVFASAQHPDCAAMRSLAMQTVRLRVHKPSARIAEWLESAAVAVIAPGNLLFECLALRTPALALSQNPRQSRDFACYPWLLSPDNIDQLPSALSSLLSKDLVNWFAYADRAQTGQSVSRLIEWCLAASDT